VFAFGVTLFQMLTGQLPFPEARGRLPCPQTRIDPTPLRCHLPRAPRGLESLLQSCMARSAEARPALDQLLPALHRFIRTGPRMWPAAFEPATSAHSMPPRLKASR
jgi:serine/threonine protein kinase